jgi:hypothetical protein
MFLSHIFRNNRYINILFLMDETHIVKILYFCHLVFIPLVLMRRNVGLRDKNERRIDFFKEETNMDGMRKIS